jgi:hypothetical protein
MSPRRHHRLISAAAPLFTPESINKKSANEPLLSALPQVDPSRQSAPWPSEAVFTSASCFGENAAKYALLFFCAAKIYATPLHTRTSFKIILSSSPPVVWPQFVIIKDSLLHGGTSPSRWLNKRELGKGMVDGDCTGTGSYLFFWY